MQLLMPILITSIGLYLNMTKVLASDALLSITPESCMAKDGMCNTKLEVSWKLIKPQDVCIVIDFPAKKYCFNNSKERKKTVILKVNKPVKVYLVTSKENEVIASARMNVLMREFKARKRQRHAWSILR